MCRNTVLQDAKKKAIIQSLQADSKFITIIMETIFKVGVVVIDKDNRILLIKEKIKKKTVPLWNIIKGTYDGGETIFEAAKRECEEEASLNVALIKSLGVNFSEDIDKVRAQFNFLAQTKEGVSASIAPKDEQEPRDEMIKEVRWFTKEEILKMNPEEFISKRAFNLLHDYIEGKIFPLEVYS